MIIGISITTKYFKINIIKYRSAVQLHSRSANALAKCKGASEVQICKRNCKCTREMQVLVKCKRSAKASEAQVHARNAGANEMQAKCEGKRQKLWGNIHISVIYRGNVSDNRF